MSAEQVLQRWAESRRLVARLDGDPRGPLVVVTGGLHGNEPAGLVAGVRVVEALARRGTELFGRVVVVAGNKPALASGRRFLDRDLNRRWSDKALEQLRRRRPVELCREDREQLELVEGFEALQADAPGGVICLDLHSTSGEATPFAVVVDIAHNWTVARALGLPVILGFDRYVDSPILDWWQARGARAIGVEGGRHDHPETADHLARVLWGTLVAAEVLTREAAPAGVLDPPAEGAGATDGSEVAWCFHIVHRHGVVPGAGFLMEPGFSNFEPVKRGQILATQRTGPVRAPMDGLIFLPLYQAQGSDGFFIIEPVERRAHGSA